MCTNGFCGRAFGTSGNVGVGSDGGDIGVEGCNSRDIRLEVTLVDSPALCSARSLSAMLPPPLLATAPSVSSDSASLLRVLPSEPVHHVGLDDTYREETLSISANLPSTLSIPSESVRPSALDAVRD